MAKIWQRWCIFPTLVLSRPSILVIWLAKLVYSSTFFANFRGGDKLRLAETKLSFHAQSYLKYHLKVILSFTQKVLHFSDLPVKMINNDYLCFVDATWQILIPMAGAQRLICCCYGYHLGCPRNLWKYALFLSYFSGYYSERLMKRSLSKM